MFDSLRETLQSSAAFSITISAIVVLVIVLGIFTMYRKAREEKEVEKKRWSKVSANMALYDPERRIVIPLEADEILVGRHGASDIQFLDMSVSRYHAVLSVSNGIWYVQDLDSKSGTYVNGTKINIRQRLYDSNEIRFGNKVVVIRERRDPHNV